VLQFAQGLSTTHKWHSVNPAPSATKLVVDAPTLAARLMAAPVVNRRARMTTSSLTLPINNPQR
jgi:hypothetical protein